jgi:hypothetical protein
MNEVKNAIDEAKRRTASWIFIRTASPEVYLLTSEKVVYFDIKNCG